MQGGRRRADNFMKPSMSQAGLDLPLSQLPETLLLPPCANMKNQQVERADGQRWGNKALIVSNRCEIGVGAGPTPLVLEPAPGVENMQQLCSNISAASQSLGNLRLNTHSINQSGVAQPAGSFLGGCLQTVYRSDPASLGLFETSHPHPVISR